MEIQLIATAVSTFLAPFIPHLLKAGKDVGGKVAELISQKGGELAWKKAQDLWGKLEERLGKDDEVQAAATMVSAQPENEMRQQMLAEILTARLESDPALAEELTKLMGGQEAVQEIIANRGSTIQDAQQKMTGRGKQTIKADNKSKIIGVRQEKSEG